MPSLFGDVRYALRGLPNQPGFAIVAGITVALGIGASIWGVSPYDPITLSSVVAVVALAGLAASYLSARRAMRVDPAIALRYE